MDPEVRGEMEGRLGHDFSDVRVHDDGAAHDSAKAVNAHAYTVGSNVVFQRDKYDPSSADGKVMLAHELTHVVQQRSGPVDGSSAPGGIKVSDPSDRFEREASANAEKAMAAPTPMAAGPAGPAGPAIQRDVDDAAPAVQRHADEEADVQRHADEEADVQRAEAPAEEEKEEEVQGAFVQREEEETQEEEG